MKRLNSLDLVDRRCDFICHGCHLYFHTMSLARRERKLSECDRVQEPHVRILRERKLPECDRVREPHVRMPRERKLPECDCVRES